MAANRIKGITIEIGGDTTKLDKALAATNKELKATQASLKDVDRLLKLDPGNTELLAQKQRLLASAMEETRQKAGTLREAVASGDAALARGEAFQEKYAPLLQSLEEAAAAYGRLKDQKAEMDRQMELGGISTEQYDQWNAKMKQSQAALRDLRQQVEEAKAGMGGSMIDQSQYDAMQRELIETESELKNLGQAADETANQLSGLDGAVDSASGSLDDLGDGAGGASGGLGKLNDGVGGISGGLGGLKGVVAGAAMEIGKKLVDAAIEAAKWVWELDEATEEYRAAMGKLNTAYEASGFSAETAKAAYTGFFEILGDTDQATEASQLLAQLAKSEEDVAKWTQIAAGVYGAFGDALPIEGLIEAVNETAKVGQVTGVLADALNWVGISEDSFNEILAATSSESERAALIMNNLGLAYDSAAESFYKNNQVLIESRDAQAQLDETQARLGESVAALKNKFFELFGPVLIIALDGVAGILSGLITVIDKIGEALDWLGGKVQDVIGFFQDLFGVSKKASSISVNTGGGSTRAAEGSRALRTASAESLPYLANGTVTRPNSPFMAVVGDNPNEPEIVSPLSTIEQAVRNVVGNGGSQAASTKVTVNFTGSLSQLARLLQPEITVETERLGPQYVG